MAAVPPLVDRVDQRFVLIDLRGERRFPYRELSPAGHYEFAVGTGHSGGRKANEEVYFAQLEDALIQALRHGKPLGVRLLTPGASASKLRVLGRHVLRYEIVQELLYLTEGLAQPPAAIIPPAAALELRAERFSLRASRPEQPQFRAKVFVAFGGRCAISECQVDFALDAAHKRGRDWRKGHNGASDGWLLRKDLHALYDAGLLDISPDGVVILASDVATHAHYGNFLGKRVRAPYCGA